MLNVFSMCEKKAENSVVRLTKLDCNNQNHINCDGCTEVFPLINYDVINTVDDSNTNKDINVLEDFYRFQERRNELLDNKKALGCNTHQRTEFDRPSYSYTQLIYMAIESSPNRALTVNDIYLWCEQNFPYYASAQHGWKNSLRHNLSINKCFKKITKVGVGGRGSLWIVDPRERLHLVSTMHRSNVTSFSSSIIIQTRSNHVDDTLGCIQVQCEDMQDSEAGEKKYSIDGQLTEVVLLNEKCRQEWTDTRLDGDYGGGSADNAEDDSLLSDTDYNDWQRCMSTLEPIYPVKMHFTPCHTTPLCLPDHNYCVPDVSSIVNNPSSVLRHSFIQSASLSSVNALDSLSTSSDYNDEDWPRTPSPLSVLVNERALPLSLVLNKNIPPLSGAKKRGRPRKHVSNVVPPLQPGQAKVHRTDPKSPQQQHRHNKRSRDSQHDRMNNMYNLNNFFNSL